MDLTIQFIIHHGFILRRSNDGKRVRLATQLSDPSKIYREEIRLPQTMTFTELKDLAFEKIETAFEIDIKKHSKEYGGTGIPWQVDCTVDVDASNSEHLFTNMNIPNEGSWETAKHLMGLAKGDAKLKFVFAVGKGTFLERALVRMFVEL